jgi:hypothetical protein
MRPTAEQFEHFLSVLSVFGLSKNFSHAFGYGITANNDSFGCSLSDVCRFLERQSGNHFRRCFATTNSTLSIGIGLIDTEAIPSLCHQFAATRRLASENQG